MDRIRKWSIAGVVVTLVTGTLLHFVHEWFGGGFWASIGAVNESTWEHLKLIFWPMFLFGIVEYIAYGRKTPGFLPAKFFSVLLGMSTIVVLFYTYTGILGYHIPLVDIFIFIIGTVRAYIFLNRKLSKPPKLYSASWAPVVFGLLLLALAVCFVMFTFVPPHIGLFLDPVSHTYGLS